MISNSRLVMIDDISQSCVTTMYVSAEIMQNKPQ